MQYKLEWAGVAAALETVQARMERRSVSMKHQSTALAAKLDDVLTLLWRLSSRDMSQEF